MQIVRLQTQVPEPARKSLEDDGVILEDVLADDPDFKIDVADTVGVTVEESDVDTLARALEDAINECGVRDSPEKILARKHGEPRHVSLRDWAYTNEISHDLTGNDLRRFLLETCLVIE
jgi:hypothetical protein